MRLNDLDLNLLVALDALLDTQSVSAAAERVHLSQSAMSGALARLRQALGDQLLLQRGRRMVRTPRAEELNAAVKEVLSLIEHKVMTRPQFDPATAARTIPVMASDFAVSMGLTGPLAEIQRIAPGIRFEILPMGSDPFGQLERDEIKLLVVPETYASAASHRRKLFEDSYVCVGWQGNSRLEAGRIDVETLGALPHVVVEFERQRPPSVFHWLHERLGQAPRRAITVSSYALVPFLVSGTDRIGLMHERMARTYAGLLSLHVMELPVEIPKIVEMVQWQAVNDTDRALMWVIDTMARLAGMPPGVLEQVKERKSHG